MSERLLVIALVCCFLAVPVLAEQKHVYALSVNSENSSQGNIAHVYLELRPGHGGVFIESTPLTKIDTQMSTRFAREYACSLSDVDCSTLDFFYVIRSSSPIIGGPSASAAATVLTYAALEDLDLRDDVVLTGTINSGGIVGPVDGMQAKVRAASEFGFSQILVSALEHDETLREQGIEVVGVRDVEQAIEYFTGHRIEPFSGTVEVPDAYHAQMEDIAESMCDRARNLRSTLAQSGENTTVLAIADEFMTLADESAGQGAFYSTASYCFSANLDYQEHNIAAKDNTERSRIYGQLRIDIETLDKQLPQELTSVADLEVYMIVRERLIDAYEELAELNRSNISSAGLSYVLERYNSAYVWSSFLGVIDSAELDISEQQMQASCSQKILEAEERISYLTYALDIPLEGTREQLLLAREDQRQGEWALCTFKAAKAKAEANAILSAAYAGEDINQSVSQKLEKVHELVAQQTSKGKFPIISYAYYEYASRLENPFSANLYAEYALELSSLSIYFPEPKKRVLLDDVRITVLLLGILIGFLSGLLVSELVRKHLERQQKKKKQAKRKKKTISKS